MCESVVPQCFALLRKDPNIVYSISDLLRVFVHDSVVAEWSGDKIVRQMFVNEFNERLDVLLNDPRHKEDSVLFSSQAHLVCLLWNGFGDSFLAELAEHNLYTKAVGLLSKLVEEDLIDSV